MYISITTSDGHDLILEDDTESILFNLFDRMVGLTRVLTVEFHDGPIPGLPRELPSEEDSLIAEFDRRATEVCPE